MKKWPSHRVLTCLALLWALPSCVGSAADNENAAEEEVKLGVAACDEYVARMTACIQLMSPERRAPAEAALKANKASWQDSLARSEQGLAQACESSLMSLRADPQCATAK